MNCVVQYECEIVDSSNGGMILMHRELTMTDNHDNYIHWVVYLR